MNQVIDLIYFLVGLAIGLVQLYVGQRHFEAEQKDRMDELRRSLAEMEKRIAILQEVSSERSFHMQDKLIDLATREEAIAEIADETREEIQELISDELRKAGVSDDRTLDLQTKVDATIQKSSSSIIEAVTDETPELSPRQSRVLELVRRGYSTRQIAQDLQVGDTTVRDLLRKIYRKTRVMSKKELIAKFGPEDSDGIAEGPIP